MSIPPVRSYHYIFDISAFLLDRQSKAHQGYQHRAFPRSLLVKELSLSICLACLEAVPFSGLVHIFSIIMIIFFYPLVFFYLFSIGVFPGSEYADFLLFPFVSQLPRSTKECPQCKHNEAVFFQSQERKDDTGMVSQAPNPLKFLARTPPLHNSLLPGLMAMVVTSNCFTCAVIVVTSSIRRRSQHHLTNHAC